MGAHGVRAIGVGPVRGSRLLLFGLHLPLIPGTERRTGVRVRGQAGSVARPRLQFWDSAGIPGLFRGKVWGSVNWNPRFA